MGTMYNNIFDESSSFDDDSLNIDLYSLSTEEPNEDIMSSSFTLHNWPETGKYNYEWFDTVYQPPKDVSSFASYEIKKTGKKRGRRNDKTEAQHTPFKNDCRMAKIQTSYFTFLIFFLNSILKKNNLKYKFFQLDGKYKSNINQKFRALLNLKTIKEILENVPISTKYKKNNDKDHNKNIIKKLKEGGHDIILNILDKNFLYFFDKIYFANLTKFNLSSFELISLDVELLPKTKLFKDLLDKNKKEDFNIYKSEMERCAKKYFFLNSKNRYDINEENST